MIEKMIKYFLIVFALYIAYSVYNNYEDINLEKKMNSDMLNSIENKLQQKTSVLRTIRQEYAKRLDFIQKNKIDLKFYLARTNKILRNINSIEGFSAKVSGVKTSKKYINVGLIKIRLSSNFKMFTVRDFEIIFKSVLGSVGLVLPFEYVNNKKNIANIGIVVLDKKRGSK